MQSALDVIKNTYDYNTCQEILSHGCESGVCSEHIYYADTIRFFDEHEGEITNFVVDSAGSEFVGEVLSLHSGDLDAYKNDMTWAFIEFVAMDVVDNQYEQEHVEDEIIGSYLTDGYNPERSMNPNRYLHV